MKLSEAIGIEPGVTSCVGAGGKTSLLLSLARELMADGLPVMLSSTTKMYYHQVEEFDPILSSEPEKAWVQVHQRLKQGKPIAWFSTRQEDKVVGLEPTLLEEVSAFAPLYTLVEADGARQKLLKAPQRNEPVLPASTKLTLGVLNCQAVGQPCTERIVHRLERVQAITGLARGQTIKLQDLAHLVGHPQGIFKASSSRKVLVITGWNTSKGKNAAEFVAALQGYDQVKVERYVLTAGWGEALHPVENYT